MRIKFLTSIAGVNYSHKPGDEVDWRDNAEAERFVKAGYSTKIGTASVLEGGKAEKPAKPDVQDKPAVERTDGKGGGGGEKATLKR